MRYLLLLLATVLLPGCHPSSSTEPATALPAAPPVAEPATAACALPAYNIPRLQPRPAQRLDSVQVMALCQQHPQLRHDFSYYNAYEHVYLLDTVRCAGFTLLTLYHADESGHHDLYYLTLDAAARRVQQATLVAAWGSDGGWSGTTTMQHQGGRLRLTAIDELWEDDPGLGFDVYTKDSAVTDLHLTPQGQLVVTPIDSSRQIVHTRAH